MKKTTKQTVWKIVVSIIVLMMIMSLIAPVAGFY